VFIATPASVKSSWCQAELGAFWGAGKPIIPYVQAGVSDADLPVSVQFLARPEDDDRLIDRVEDELRRQRRLTDAQVARACCRIEKAHKDVIGTGYVREGGFVVTTAEVGARAGKRWSVIFERRRCVVEPGPVQHRAGAVEAAIDATLDDLPRLSLATKAPLPGAVCKVFVSPAIADGAVVALPAELLDQRRTAPDGTERRLLHCPVLAGQDVKGLKGSPVLSEGQVIGHVDGALVEGDRIAFGLLAIVPIDTVRNALGIR
jgi:hypothetical protein